MILGSSPPASSLPELLEQKERERKEVVSEQSCLFCKTVLRNAQRSALFSHLWETHHFHVGHPDNLIFLDLFLERMRVRLHEERGCLFCDKTFPDFGTLRLHMRKKQHMKIEGRKEYDRFYLANYIGKKIKTNKDEDDDDDDDDDDDQDDYHAGKQASGQQMGIHSRDDSDGVSGGRNSTMGNGAAVVDDWDAWVDDSGHGVLCLMCDTKAPTSTAIIDHMRLRHGFDLLALTRQWNLDFFGRIKLINFMRKAYAEQQEVDWTTLQPNTFLENVQYLFPTDEEDLLLTHEFDFDYERDELAQQRRRLSV